MTVLPTSAGNRQSVGSRRNRFVTVVGQLRYLLIGFVAVCAAGLAGGRGDWDYFAYLGHQLFGDAGLHLYERYRDAQTGPLSLLAARMLSETPRGGFVLAAIVCGGAGLLTLRQVELGMAADEDTERRNIRVLLAGMLLLVWWSMFGRFGHVDDAFGLFCTTAALRAHRSNRPFRAALLIGLAIGLKPWFVLFWPLTLPSSLHARPWTLWVTPPVVAAAIAAGFWLPFVLAAPSSLDGLSPTVLADPASVLRLVGFERFADDSALRVIQLVLASCVVLITVLRQRPEAAIAGGIAVRILLDPGVWAYYSAAFVLGAVIWDLQRTRRLLPVFGLATSCTVLPPWLLPAERFRGVLRLVGSATAILASILSPTRHTPAQTDDD